MSRTNAHPSPSLSPVPDGELALEVRSASMGFGGVMALGGVDLTVGRAEVLGVIGPNGAGKTTLFDVISGFRRPTEGSVHLHGRDVTGRSGAWRARHGLRRTFQRQQVFGALSVEENLLVALEDDRMRGGVLVDLLGLASRRRAAVDHGRAVDAALEACGLVAVRHVAAGSLPIGIARMVELARALVHGPSLLLLDEPTSGLGEAETAIFSEALRQYRSERECGVVLVEHDVGFVMDHADRVAVLDLGRIIAIGTPSEIRADPEVQRAYLG